MRISARFSFRKPNIAERAEIPLLGKDLVDFGAGGGADETGALF